MTKTFKEFVAEALITPSTEPETLSLWHGGNLDGGPLEDYKHSKGRFEYAPGLYLTTSYNVVEKYKKGSRKLYLVTIRKGTEVGEVRIPVSIAMEFVSDYVIRAKRKDVIDAINRMTKEDAIDADIFLNIMINNEAIKASHSSILKKFLVQQGADYSIVDNAFGWHERMVIVFNNRVIKKIQLVTPKDKIETYDLPTEWS